jgi:hypothetical protein
MQPIMENLTLNPKSSIYSSNNTSKKIRQASYRGFASIDQEMGRDIAMEFFKPSKKTFCSQKGFLFTKG